MAATTAGRRGTRAPIVGINVTPMVDIVLVLLIIMMVSATYIVSQSLKVELPKTSSSDESTASVAAVILKERGELYFNDVPVTKANLVHELRRAYARNHDVSLIISADRRAQHGAVVQVIDLAKEEGIHSFAINVEQAE